MEKQNSKTYIAIDLKSFYASVECVERGMDPLATRLVVADISRTEKTICLAVTPALKAYGISGRARLFEVVQRAKQIKAETGQELDYIVAPPRMGLYMEYSSRIFDIYLKYVAAEDIHVYSVDEVFMDVTDYLKIYNTNAHDLAMKMIRDVLSTTGITATAGIGTNMYLCKVAMDIVAKHIPADENGVRIAELDEFSYRKLLWNHRPLTDFWRVGRGYQKRLEAAGLYTMGDVARCSLGGPNEYYNEDLLYKMFGVNAELLIDHAWGYEPCTIAQVKSYRPSSNSLSSGQVLQHPYTNEKAKLIVREMTELLVLDLVSKGLVTNQVVLNIVYDIDNLKDEVISRQYKGEIVKDGYGRAMPKGAHGSMNLPNYTSSTRQIVDAMLTLFDKITDKLLLVRKVYVVANRVISEKKAIQMKQEECVQLDLFSFLTDEEDAAEQAQKVAEQPQKVTEQSQKVAEQSQKAAEKAQKTVADDIPVHPLKIRSEEEREKSMQHAILDIQKKYGKNAILKGMNLQEGAMTMERNSQIGGHKA